MVEEAVRLRFMGEGATLELGDFLPGQVECDTQFVERAFGDAASFAEQGQEQVLGTDLGILGPFGFLDGKGQDLFEVRGAGQAAEDPGLFLAAGDEPVELLGHRFGSDCTVLKHLRADTKAVLGYGVQDVLGSHILLPVVPGETFGQF